MRSLPPSQRDIAPTQERREQPTPDFREATGILRRHRWLLLACPLVGVALGLLFAAKRDPSYEASSLVAMGETPASFTGLVAAGQPDAQRTATEIQMLQSRRLAREVVDSLGLQVAVLRPAGVGRSALIERVEVTAETPAAQYRLVQGSDGTRTVTDEKSDSVIGRFAANAPIVLRGAQVVLSPDAGAQEEIVLAVRPTVVAVEAVVSSLDVGQPSADVNMIRVAYRSSDPELARDVPNVLTARYVALREMEQKSTARKAAIFLREQLDSIRDQLNLSEELLRNYREANRVIDPQLEASTHVSQLAQLRAERASKESERSALARAYTEVRRSAAAEQPGVASPYRRLLAFPTLLQNQAATELLSTLATVENQRAELARRPTPEDPNMQVLNARIAEIERGLQTLASTHLQGLTSQVASLDSALGRSQAQLDAMPEKEMQLGRLSRQPRVLETLYEQLHTRLKEAEIAEAVQDQSVRVVDAATLPLQPDGHGAPVFAVAGAAMALLFGIGLVFAREYADQAVRTRADVQAAIGIPVLGMIPDAKSAMLPEQRNGLLARPRKELPATTGNGDGTGTRPVHSASSNHPASPALLIPAQRAPTPWSDAYNRLHTNIMFAQPDAEMKTLLFTSPLPGDGKTSTAANFAVTLAQSGLKVLLIDADLRRGRVHELFDTSPTPGLSDLLADSPVPGVLRHVDVGSGKPLRYIASGKTQPNPVQLLSSTGMRALLDIAEQEYDRVIIDSPPLNLFPDAVALSSAVDGVIVVARAGVTPFDALVDTAEQLRHANTRVVGAVLNGIDFERDVSYDTSYRWYRSGKAYAQAGGGA